MPTPFSSGDELLLSAMGDIEKFKAARVEVQKLWMWPHMRKPAKENLRNIAIMLQFVAVYMHEKHGLDTLLEGLDYEKKG